jgi:hypothetical protein
MMALFSSKGARAVWNRHEIDENEKKGDGDDDLEVAFQ